MGYVCVVIYTAGDDVRLKLLQVLYPVIEFVQLVLNIHAYTVSISVLIFSLFWLSNETMTWLTFAV